MTDSPPTDLEQDGQSAGQRDASNVESPAEDARDETPLTRDAGDPASDVTSPDAGAAGPRSAQHSLREGFAAFRSVREAQARHAEARSELHGMRERLERDTETLRRRLDIEERYPQIVAEQSAEREQAHEQAAEALRRAEELEDERGKLDRQLADLKRSDEERLRPYRNLAESTKGRSDDAARALAEARRAAKSAEQALSEATRQRDQRISNANRAVDNARERLRSVQSELEEQGAGEREGSEAGAQLARELEKERRHLEAARAEVSDVSAEADKDVEAAQQRLFDQRKLVKQAERDAEATKAEATERRGEYDELLRQSQEAQRALGEQIKERTSGAEAARREREEAEARAKVADELLEEAEAIHASPQETIELRREIARQQTDLDIQQDAVDALARDERALRKGTFRQRLVVVVAILAGVALVAALVGVLLINR